MPTRRYRQLLLLALLLEVGFVCLRQLADLELKTVEFIAIQLVESLLYIVCCFLITRPTSGGAPARQLMVLIWLAGIAFRLTVVGVHPTLSDDLNRYRWHGKLQAAGGNPYLETPADPRWELLRDPTYPDINRKDLPSVYGPVLEHLYAGYYRLVAWLENDELRQVRLFKLPFALLELGVALALVRLLAVMGLPRQWVLIYLWSPLMVVEFWAQGHNDPVAVLFVLLALAAALKSRWSWAFTWLTLATLTKFWPAILLPFFLLRQEQDRRLFRWKPALISIPIAVVVSWPYFDGIWHVQELLRGFLGGWRNNDSLYGLLYALAGEDFERGTALVSGLLIVGLAALWWKHMPLVESALWAVVLLLFLSANCFPWYLSWLLPFLAVYPNAALLLWTALISLSYHVVMGYGALGVWQESPEFRLLEYVPVYVMLIGQFVVRRFAGARRGIDVRTSEG